MSYPLQFGVVLLLVVLGCAKVTLQGQFSRRYIRNTSDSVLFNAELFVAIAIVMMILFPMGKIGGDGILLAALTAICTVIFQTTYSLALKSGPVSLTVLLGNFSLFITIIFSIIAYKESIYLTQLVGIGFLILSMILGVKKTNDEKGITGKWILLVLAMILSNGVASIFMKIFSKEISGGAADEQSSFMALSYLIAAALAAGLFFITSGCGKRERASFGVFDKGALLFVGLIGIILGIYQRFYMLGLANIDSGFMFPTYSGMQSLGMSFIGVLMFKDKLTVRQWFGIACGILCVVLMNVRLGKLF
jgi:drug/metabolite transporter (DMT)-like permease